MCFILFELERPEREREREREEGSRTIRKKKQELGETDQ